ncbi:hypothetical protein [Halorarum salinum]|uniref:Uncharacterized protein n=1 Tax=Halorarum salinum TaxID=2743089 RepID=A0A7D5QG82_9EURY|nr:hypothetical protein [Halobaculum salinum]QLG63861.1 hypothetical protein HUG12_19900 [Halobaculum salinum]
MRRTTAAIILACVLGGVLAAGGVGAAPEYGLSVAGSVDTPNRTVPVDGEEFAVSEVASVEPGDALDVEVTAPDEGPYELLLYDSERRIVTRADAAAGERTELETDGFEAGAYLLVLRDGETVRAVHPVVIDGYDVEVDAPGAAEAGTETSVAVSVAPGQSTGSPDRVTVVAWNGEETVSAVADRQGDGRYVATLDLADLDPGEYTLVATAHGERVVYGRQEPLGTSDEHALRVTDEPVEGGSGSASGSGSGGADDGSAADGTDTPTGTTQSDVITPGEGEESGDGASDPSGEDGAPGRPGNGSLLPLGVGGAAVLVGYAYLRRRTGGIR